MTRIFDALKKARTPRSTRPSGSREPGVPLATLAAGVHAPAAPSDNPPSAGAQGAPRARMSVLRRRVPAPSRAVSQAAVLDTGIVPTPDVIQQMTSLRVSLESALPDAGCRSIMFNGSQSGEGTTTVAMQYAATLARDTTQHVLLVDAHARRPSLERDAERRVIAMKNSGRWPAAKLETESRLVAVPLAAEMGTSGRLDPSRVKDLLDVAAQHFDWVILDGPPLLESPDAVPLSVLADGVVLTILAGKTKRPVLDRSLDLLQKAGARVLGSVLNRRRLEIPDFIYRRI